MAFGFLKKIGNAIGTVVTGAVKVVKTVAKATVEVVKEVASDIRDIFKTKPIDPTPPPVWPPVDHPRPDPDSEPYNPDDDDPGEETITYVAEIVEDWHRKACKRASQLENHTKTIYLRSYERIIKELAPFMDVSKIKKFMTNKAKRFNNQMRDELNDVISQSNYKFMSIINDDAKAQRYVNNAYDEASRNLYVTLEEVIAETNSFIVVHTTRYLDEEKAALAELQQQYINLSKEGSTRDAELDKIAKEYASLLFIQEAVNSIKVN